MNKLKLTVKVKVADETVGISSHPADEAQIRQAAHLVNSRYNVLRVLYPDLSDRQILSLLSIHCLMNPPQFKEPTLWYRIKENVLAWRNKILS